MECVIDTRLGRVAIEADRVPATNILIVTKGAELVVRRKKPLVIPVGGVVLPRRSGRNKGHNGSAVYRNVFDALRGMRGASGYYGGTARGEIFRIHAFVRGLAKQIESAETEGVKNKLKRMFERYKGDLYDRNQLVSRLDTWANALQIELADEKAVLSELLCQFDLFMVNRQVRASTIKMRADNLRLAPFIGLRVEINEFVRGVPEELSFAMTDSKQRDLADGIFDTIHGHLRRIEFEEINFELKEFERAFSDDIRRNDTKISVVRFRAALASISDMIGQFLNGNNPTLERGDRRHRSVILDCRDALSIAYADLSSVHRYDYAIRRVTDVRKKMVEAAEGIVF